MPPGGDKIVTGYKLYIADELGKVFKTTVLFMGIATRTEFLARPAFSDEWLVAFWRPQMAIIENSSSSVETLVIRIENLIKTRMLELNYWSQLSLHLQLKDSIGENDTSLDSIH